MSNKKDYYEVLGISKNASEDEIKLAFKRLAKQYHPDRNPGDKTAEEKFKEINEAYSVLSNAESRRKYDQFGFNDPGMNFNTNMNFNNFGDMFNSFFGGFNSFTTGQERERAYKGGDITAGVTISFKESVFGTEKTIKIARTVMCSDCNGTGVKKGTRKKTCSECNGKGYKQVIKRTPFGQAITQTVCNKCNGTGEIIEHPCPKCKGVGYVTKNVNITVKIPSGIADGQVIQISGQGDVGINGGIAGDLYLQVSVEKDALYERQNDDLILEVPITYSQAVLGDKLTVYAFSKKIECNIPCGSHSGDLIRIKGEGIYNKTFNETGDFVVRLNIEIPQNLNKEQISIIKKIKESENIENFPKILEYNKKITKLFSGK